MAVVLEETCVEQAWQVLCFQTLLPEIWEGAEYTGVGCCLPTIYFGLLGSCSSPFLFFSASFPSLVCMLLGVSRPTAVLVCLSGMNGSTLWSSPLPEEARDITCLDLMPGNVAGTICLVTGTHKMFSAFNATSGKDHLPQKISASVSSHLRLQQSGEQRTFPLSHGGKSHPLLWKVLLREITERGVTDWVPDPRFNLNRNCLKVFDFQIVSLLCHLHKTAEHCLFVFDICRAHV